MLTARGTARHAMAIDELRSDFEPTIWQDNSRKLIYHKKKLFYRPIANGQGNVLLHRSVKQCYEDAVLKYWPKTCRPISTHPVGGRW